MALTLVSKDNKKISISINEFMNISTHFKENINDILKYEVYYDEEILMIIINFFHNLVH